MHPADEDRRVRKLDPSDEERIDRMNDEANDALEHGDAIVYDEREYDPHSIESMNAEALSNLRGEFGL